MHVRSHSHPLGWIAGPRGGQIGRQAKGTRQVAAYLRERPVAGRGAATEEPFDVGQDLVEAVVAEQSPSGGHSYFLWDKLSLAPYSLDLGSWAVWIGFDIQSILFALRATHHLAAKPRTGIRILFGRWPGWRAKQ
jgi:hypothetical protein